MSSSLGLRLSRALACTVALLGALAVPTPASAQPAVLAEGGRPAIGFSNLVVRLENDPDIGIAGDELRVHILETLRKAGFRAVGAESLVFGKDHAERADFLLGGTVRELDCLQSERFRCRIGIEWQLLDVRRDAVVYTALTRHRAVRSSRSDAKRMGIALVLGALKSLARRDRFTAALDAGHKTSRGAASTYPPMGFRECTSPAVEMPDGAEEVLRAAVLVQAGDGFGSGFLLSPDGFVLTAAHVVDSPNISVRMRDGSVRDASVIRVAKDVDAALLRVADASATPCLVLDREPMKVGTEVYAIGSPASEKLAFSLTRGIVSGVRNLDGTELLQTDASVSPGNSGGPLIDKQGHASAIVSWKIAGVSVQGVAFCVPVASALRGLGLTPAAATDPGLVPATPIASKAESYTDRPDAIPSIDPLGDARRAKEARDAERDRLTPGYVFTLRWGGAALAGVGTVAGLLTYLAYDANTTTQPEFNRLRVVNALAWVGALAGAGMFVTSYFLVPSVPPKRAGSLAVDVGLDGRFQVRGSF